MAQKLYPNEYDHNALSVLPTEAQRALKGLGEDLFEKLVSEERIKTIRQSLSEVDVWQFRRAKTEIWRCGNLRSWPRTPFRSRKRFAKIINLYEVTPKRAREQNATFNRNVERNPDLAFILIFDAYGYVREAATKAIDEPLHSPLEVLALFDLMNNWVREVRDAATQTVAHVFPLTDAKVLSKAMETLVFFMPEWGRWDKTRVEALIKDTMRPDIVGELVSRLIAGRARRSGALYAYLQRFDCIDAYHQNIFERARQPHLRAMALNILLRQRAKWVVGQKRMAIDKVFNQYKSAAIYDCRSRPFDKELRTQSTSRALTDKSALVRSMAAQFLIDYPAELQLDIAAIARQLSADPAKKVSSRGEYLLRQLTNTNEEG